ncbi:MULTISPECIES: hypothetical protein [Clostridium]|uniref:hypothetical protein n=1 Tax=Clostridium TaxID=1485 RepID=UPI0002CB7408|nr:MULTISPECIES: hypothetical protein [Clostridium]AXB85498.1 hypothetical protein DRB99_11110 [Clostridium butyricum]EMU55199.1 hypothetical protein CBDKU1_08110 [Clostridium butyricum DKU-01]MDB2139293.1 hypothetical protein [Clostridium butyricum]MDB2156569.1 hypothetical protein [Clostridium butyricum]MDI9208310.1 hypothetical protein [Clostridium butyricum]
MERILNYNYIQEKVKVFSWQDIKCIYEIHYYQDFNEYYEEVFLLDIVFIIFTIDNKQYSVKIRFHEVENMNLYIGSKFVQIVCFDIVDIKDDGWSSLNYLVHDLEQDGYIKFYCNKIEIISVDESNYKL